MSEHHDMTDDELDELAVITAATIIVVELELDDARRRLGALYS